MERARQLTVCSPNKPGMLARICRCLADAQVNILAISVVESTEVGLIRMITSDAKAATTALEALGISVATTPVRLIELPNKVGALAEMAERLAKRKVNINFVYGSAMRGARKSVIVVEARSGS